MRWLALAWFILGLLLTAGNSYGAPPSLRATGSIGANTGDCTAGTPAGVTTGDLLIMWVESRSEQAATATGWTVFEESHTAATTTSGSRLTVMYKIAESGTPSMVVTDTGDHTICRAVAINVLTIDTTMPMRLISEDIRETATASVSIPGGATATEHCLVFHATSGHIDQGSDGVNFCDSTANANLSSFSELGDNFRTAGDGGILCFTSGTLATSGGDVGATTITTNVSGDVATSGGEITVATCQVPPAATRRVMTVQ